MAIVLLGAGAVSTTMAWYLRKTGHGDTVCGLDQFWRKDLSPWSIAIEGDCIYGRGTADNKGQHSINMAALAAVISERGRLGFNVKPLIEMGEEVGSIGLQELCEANKEGLLKADLLIASDGPRIARRPCSLTPRSVRRPSIRTPDRRRTKSRSAPTASFA